MKLVEQRTKREIISVLIMFHFLFHFPCGSRSYLLSTLKKEILPVRVRR